MIADAALPIFIHGTTAGNAMIRRASTCCHVPDKPTEQRRCALMGRTRRKEFVLV